MCQLLIAARRHVLRHLFTPILVSPEHKELKVKKSEVNANASGNSESREFSKKIFYTADEISALLEKKSSHEDELRRVSSLIIAIMS